MHIDDIMYETDEPILYQYALNLFILLYSNALIKNTNVKKDHAPIVAANFDEIVSQIPLNFIEFCDVKINYKKGGVYQSLIDLIENSGAIGLNALHRTFHKRGENEMKQIIKKKSKIKNIKAKIIDNYKKKALKFDCSVIKNLATDVKVTGNNRMYILVELLETTIPYFLKTQNHFYFSVRKIKDNDDLTSLQDHMKKCLITTTCGHFSNTNFCQICPHCNSSINFLLPNYNELNDTNLKSEHFNIFTDSFDNEKII